jgi:hypothetical protein
MTDAQKSEVVEINHQKFKLAAAGTGIIACAAPKGKWRKSSSLKVLLAMRDASVGEGFGITGGGFVECAAVDSMPVGSVVDIAADAYRENDEETKRFFEFITQGAFLDRVQGITNVAVRTNDLNRVHACMFYALALTKAEWKKLKTLPPGPERKGPFIPATMSWSPEINRSEPERYITLVDHHGENVMDRFFHKHELRAFGLLAWHAEKGKLWHP